MTIRVFVADDHGVVRDGLRSLLENELDVTVVGEAADGRQAVRMVSELKPDVVVIDITMPELNGIDATEQILEVCPSTRVVVLSMHANKEHIYRALKAGVRGYVLKESVGMELVEAIRKVYNNRFHLSLQVGESVIEDYIQSGRNASASSPLEQLSSREREVLQLVVEGKSSSDIANTLFISPKTVETYRSRIMQKLEVSDLPSLVKLAIQHGLVAL